MHLRCWFNQTLRQLVRSPCMLCAAYAGGSEICQACAQQVKSTPWGVSSLGFSGRRIPVLWREHYGGPLTPIIYGAKYRGDWGQARLLGACLGALPKPWLGNPPVVIPVPLTNKRLGARGYNQSQMIAAEAARHWGLALKPRWLKKTKHTRRQATLSLSQRGQNLCESFQAHANLAGQRVLLIDDIMTTGATLREAMRAIDKAGGTVISAAVIAHVPKDQRKNNAFQRPFKPLRASSNSFNTTPAPKHRPCSISF